MTVSENNPETKKPTKNKTKKTPQILTSYPSGEKLAS